MSSIAMGYDVIDMGKSTKLLNVCMKCDVDLC